MSDQFLNPYHFFPVKKTEKEGWGDKNQFLSEIFHHCRHDRYATEDGIRHGRIICKMTTKTPTFIGAERISEASEDYPAVVVPFELDDKPAIPASSIRGVISSLAEAASHSSLRVLEDRSLSYRKNPRQALSALGMIHIKTDEEGKRVYLLQPIALPTLESQNSKYMMPSCYKKFFFENEAPPKLKVYISRKGKDPDNPENKITRRTYSEDRKEFYYMDLKKDWEFDPETGALADDSLLKYPSKILKNRNSRKKVKNKNFCIGQRPKDHNHNPKHERVIEKHEKDNLTRGIIRVLDLPRDEGSGNFSKHGLFIPYPEGAEKWPAFKIPQHVVDRFHRLCDERTDFEKSKNLPYHPVETPRNKDNTKHGKHFRLKNRDIVYFKPNEDGEEIEEISISSIWRKGPVKNNKLATTFTFFEKIDPELLPFNSKRQKISPAEMVFGFIEDQATNEEPRFDKNNAMAYSGRVRFSHGLMEETDKKIYMSPVTLKILDSPKPPSPAMYFKKKNPNDPNGFIEKKSLNISCHEPMGRKVYLHHCKEEEVDKNCWKTAFDEKSSYKNNNEKLKKGRLKQKVQITPLSKELTFWFHVDFDNLNSYELGMLLYALDPSAEFMHKIGMGKPLGLGSVKIETVGVFLIDRKNRYLEEDPFETPKRYSEAWMESKKAFQKIPLKYEREKKIKGLPKIAELKEGFRNTIHPDVVSAIKLLGKRAKDFPVHTPINSGQKHSELETFKWFVQNDKKKKQYLMPIDKDSKRIEPLEKN